MAWRSGHQCCWERVEPSRRTLGHWRSDLEGDSGNPAPLLLLGRHRKPLPPAHTPERLAAPSQTQTRWSQGTMGETSETKGPFLFINSFSSGICFREGNLVKCICSLTQGKSMHPQVFTLCFSLFFTDYCLDLKTSSWLLCMEIPHACHPHLVAVMTHFRVFRSSLLSLEDWLQGSHR